MVAEYDVCPYEDCEVTLTWRKAALFARQLEDLCYNIFVKAEGAFCQVLRTACAVRPQNSLGVNGGVSCVVCMYRLHFLQSSDLVKACSRLR